jgi:hypothetical protein
VCLAFHDIVRYTIRWRLTYFPKPIKTVRISDMTMEALFAHQPLFSDIDLFITWTPSSLDYPSGFRACSGSASTGQM